MRRVLIDPHVHLRDWEQAHKETLRHAFDVAWRCGISALFEMPNTVPPLTTRNAVVERIALADRERARLGEVRAPFHGLYLGLTAELRQVRAVVGLHGELFPRVVGCKLYAGHSTGRMGVITVAEQYRVWRTLARARYRGVVAVHAEREDLLRPRDEHLRPHPDRLRPQEEHADAVLTHGLRRPPLAEIASVQTQIALAEAAGFRGTLHICHVSTPESLEIIRRERAGLPFRLTAGVTPHHLLLDTEHVPPGPEQIVNPPIRDGNTRFRLLSAVIRGDADWIESDHAPHTRDEKLHGAAGLPGIPAFRHLVEVLNKSLEAPLIQKMTGERVLEVFEIDPDLIPANPEATKPFTEETRAAIAREYPWDPYWSVAPIDRG